MTRRVLCCLSAVAVLGAAGWLGWRLAGEPRAGPRTFARAPRPQPAANGVDAGPVDAEPGVGLDTLAALEPLAGALATTGGEPGSADEAGGWAALVAELDSRLGELPRDRALEVADVLVRVYDRDVSVEARSAVLVALEHLGGAAGARALATIARERDGFLALASTRLSRIDAPAAAGALVEIFEAEGRDGPLAVAALRALGKTRRRDRVPLLAALCGPANSAVVRREAAEALGQVAVVDGIDALAPLLAESDDRLRRTAVRALGRIRSERSRELLDAHRDRTAPDSRERELVDAGLATLRGQLLSPGSPFR